MKKFIKITAIVLAFILILIAVLPFIFKGKIVEIVKSEINKNVNAKVDFQDFSLSLFRSFPDFSLGIEGFSVIGKDVFEGDTLTYIPELKLTLDLGSVISGDNYEIKSISIDKPFINIIVLRNGMSNYDIALADTSDVSEPEEPSAFKLQLKKFEITNARVVYNDMEGDMSAHLAGFDALMSGDLTASQTDLDILASIESLDFVMEGISYLKKATIDWDAILGADLDKFLFTFKDNKLKLNNINTVFEGWVAMPEADIDMDLKFAAEKADFKSLLSLVPAIYLTDMEGLKAKGKAGFSGFAKGIYNDVLMPAFGIKMFIENGMFQYPDLPQSVDNVQLIAEVLSPSSDLDKMSIDVSKFHFDIAKNPMDILLKLKTPMSDPNIDAKFKGKLNLADVNKFYPMEEGMKLSGLLDMDVALKGKQSSIEKEKYNEFLASGFINLNEMKYSDSEMPDGVIITKASMDFSPAYIALTAFDALYQGSSMKANGKLSNYIDYLFGDGILKGSLNFSSEFLDLDKLMGSEETVATETPADTAALQAFIVPDNIDFTLQSTIGRLKYDNIDIQSVFGIIRIADSRISMDNLNMELLGGKLNLSGFYSTVSAENPSISMVLGIKDFNIKKSYDAFNTIKLLAPISQYIEGNFSTLLSFNSEMDMAMNPIFNTIDISGLLKTSVLSAKSSPIFAKIANAMKYDKLNNLNTNPLMIDFVVEDGNLEVRPFQFVIDGIPAELSGTANVDKTINYRLNMEVPTKKLGAASTSMINNLQSQATSIGMNLGNTENIPVNIFISGNILDPTVKVAVANPAQDAQDQIESIVKDEIQNAKDKAQAEIDKKKQEALLKAEQAKNQAQDSLNKIINKQKEDLEKKKREAEAAAKKKLEEEAKKKLKKFF